MKENHEMCPKTGDTLYKIGMFAAMNRVTVKTLRFYEQQGLLLPKKVDGETGYRYYAMAQMADVQRIAVLKQAGLTLEDIASIDAGTDERSVLLARRAELMRRIAEMTRQAAAIDSRLAREGAHPAAPVLVRNLPGVTVASMTVRLASYEDLFEVMPRMGALMEESGCTCALPEYCYTAYPEPGFREEDILAEVCEAVTEAKEPHDGLEFKAVPGVAAACVYHRGPYETLPESYGTVLDYVRENGYVIAGPIRERYIDGVWNRDSETEWLTEIQVPVAVAANEECSLPEECSGGKETI
ncbi:MAG: MerR family transcriptional regulator [Clostridia bacterium]|nr:MerR family transcriptional regulator [Clostridia bacterium]